MLQISELLLAIYFASFLVLMKIKGPNIKWLQMSNMGYQTSKLGSIREIKDF